jgi:hypothetical protein
MPSTRSRRLLLVCGLLLLALVGGRYLLALHRSTQGWGHFVSPGQQQGPIELSVNSAFLSDTSDPEQRYQALFQYFLRGALKFTDAAGSRINFPGAPSANGFDATGLEGFARTSTLFAAWLASGRAPILTDGGNGSSIDLVTYLKRAILAGTDPHSDGYWGKITDFNQRIVDAADVARILWMTRKQVWQQLDENQRTQISNWLLQVDYKKTYDNNWLLFPVTVDVVMRALGRQTADPTVNYLRFKTYYLSNGWYFNSPEGVDFYNTWGISYELFWLTLVDPAFDRDFIRSGLLQSAQLTSHLISPGGIPIMGRSICYRPAVSVPLVAESFLDSDSIAPGLARHSMDALWRYFVAHGILQDGTLTQGYFRTNLRFLDLYSGPGSCNWGLRSLVLAYLNAPGSAFWTEAEKPLPVQQGDYRLAFEKLGWVVSGNHDNGEITVEIPRNAASHPKAARYAWWNRLLEHLLRKPMRPENKAFKYDRPVYSSLHPYTDEP